MRIFITGGTGFLGSHVLRGLMESSNEVYALTRSIERLSFASSDKIKPIVGDMNDIMHVECPDFDVCMHFAWGGVNRTGVSDMNVQEQNFENTKELLQFCRKHHCKTFIDAGSRQEYAPANYKITEESLCDPISEYGKWKLKAYIFAKQFCKDEQMQYIHYRIFSVYGEGDHPWSLISTAVAKLSKNEDMSLGPCTQQWSFLHVDDFVRLVMNTLKKKDEIGKCEIYNVASEDVRVLKEFVIQIKELMKSKGELKFGTYVQNVESVTSLIPSVERAKMLLKWQEQVSFEEGIKRMDG